MMRHVPTVPQTLMLLASRPPRDPLGATVRAPRHLSRSILDRRRRLTQYSAKALDSEHRKTTGSNLHVFTVPRTAWPETTTSPLVFPSWRGCSFDHSDHLLSQRRTSTSQRWHPVDDVNQRWKRSRSFSTIARRSCPTSESTRKLMRHLSVGTHVRRVRNRSCRTALLGNSGNRPDWSGPMALGSPKRRWCFEDIDCFGG